MKTHRFPGSVLGRIVGGLVSLPVLFCLLCLPCWAAGEGVPVSGKQGNLSIAYGIVALLSLLLVIFYALFEKKKDRNFFLLYICVAIANLGYLLQSVSGTLRGALVANGISYVGAGYAVLIMLLIIMHTCQTRQRKWLLAVLFFITTIVVGIAASGDLGGWYYSQVALEQVNGMSRLVKVYGPLHCLYPMYLLVYVLAMVAVILHAAGKKRIACAQHAIFLVAIVLSNVAVWAIEQFIDIRFEFLSVSLIVTEIMLLLMSAMLRDYGLSSGSLAAAQQGCASELPPNMAQLFTDFSGKVTTLSTAEKRILQYYIDGYEISDIPDLAYISIHTVKKHNRSIYQKLEVASRDELMLYIELFRRCGRLEELVYHEP